jgi:outer membrane immunogenic protein
MKKLLLGTLTWAALTGAAFAADMPVRPAAAPAYSNWNGWYVGINAGGGFQSQEATLSGTDTGFGGILRPYGIPTFTSSIGVPMWVSGPLGGFTVGWNWQAGWWLAGIEADIDCANITGVTTLNNAVGGFVPVTVQAANTLDRFGTVRARLGWLAGPTSSFLLYATGGFAYGRNTLELSAICPTCGPPANLYAQDRATKTGWTAGGGIEWMFLQSWTVKGEYLYADLGSQTVGFAYPYGPFLSTAALQNNDRYHILRIGVNYIFGGLGKGVVAAY